MKRRMTWIVTEHFLHQRVAAPKAEVPSHHNHRFRVGEMPEYFVSSIFRSP
jgi:hypothetical protein